MDASVREPSLSANPPESAAISLLLTEIRRIHARIDEIAANISTVRPEAYNLTDSAKMLGGISTRQVIRLLDAGYLTRVKSSGRILITRKSLENYCRGDS